MLQLLLESMVLSKTAHIAADVDDIGGCLGVLSVIVVEVVVVLLVVEVISGGCCGRRRVSLALARVRKISICRCLFVFVGVGESVVVDGVVGDMVAWEVSRVEAGGGVWWLSCCRCCCP